MNFEVLKYFIMSEKVGSFTKAANLLFLSQQGLNKSITNLEDELGCKLTLRSKQGIELTENGQIFLKHAKKIMRCYNEMAEDFLLYRRNLELLSDRRIALTVSHVCLQTIITPMLKRKELPTISLVEADAVRAFELMDAQKGLYLLDLSSYIIDDTVLEQDYEVLPLATAKLGIITRKSLIPDLPRVVSVERVAKMPLGLYDSETTHTLYKEIYKDHPLENIVFSTKSHRVLVENMLLGRFAFLADSFFWAQLPQGQKKGEDNVIFAEIENSAPIILAFVYRKDNPLSAEALQFIDSFITVFKRMQNVDPDVQ